MPLLGAPASLSADKNLATVGRVRKLIDTHGQTGVIDVRHLWTGAGGTIQLTRSGGYVELAVWGVPNDASAGTQMTLPEGYRPPATRLFNDAVYTEVQGASRVNVYGNGRVVLYGLTVSEPVYFTIGWHTEEPFPELRS